MNRGPRLSMWLVPLVAVVLTVGAGGAWLVTPPFARQLAHGIAVDAQARKARRQLDAYRRQAAARQPGMNAICAQIRAALRDQPGVNRIEVSYQDDPLDSGGSTAMVALEMGHGAPYTTVVVNATGLVWKSRLDPLSTIIIGVSDQQDHRLVWDDTRRRRRRQGDAGARPRAAAMTPGLMRPAMRPAG